MQSTIEDFGLELQRQIDAANEKELYLSSEVNVDTYVNILRTIPNLEIRESAVNAYEGLLSVVMLFKNLEKLFVPSEQEVLEGLDKDNLLVKISEIAGVSDSDVRTMISALLSEMDKEELMFVVFADTTKEYEEKMLRLFGDLGAYARSDFSRENYDNIANDLTAIMLKQQMISEAKMPLENENFMKVANEVIVSYDNLFF